MQKLGELSKALSKDTKDYLLYDILGKTEF